MILRVTEVVNTEKQDDTNSPFPRCNCLLTEIRVRTQKNNVRVLVKQCLECGHSAGGVSKKNRDLSRYKPFDDEFRKRRQEEASEFYEERRRQWLAEHDKKSAEWRLRYEQHINSMKWKAIREKVLARDCFTCRGCGVKRAQQVHHLTYDHLGNELLFELVAVCIDCHRIIHPDMGK